MTIVMFQSRFPKHVYNWDDVLNTSIGTVEERQRVNSKKRKSIFDGCEESFSKKRSQKEVMTFDIQTPSQKTTPFILSYQCKVCCKKFPKFGNYKIHVNNGHKVLTKCDPNQEIDKSREISEDLGKPSKKKTAKVVNMVL